MPLMLDFFAMATLSLYDEAALQKQIDFQRKRHWDIDSISWDKPIDLTKLLVPLDEEALFFPGATREDRTAISQLMGLTIAACICEMEECLMRLRPQAWDAVLAQMPVSPEFEELGNLFFVEEQKHSQVFRKYLSLFAKTLGVELSELTSLLPKIRDTKTEWLLKKNLEQGGYAFWWIVAEVEQEFLFLHQTMTPFKKDLEPLYYEIHRKHFEEESRHISLPHMILQLITDRSRAPLRAVHRKTDLILAQALQALWTGVSLEKTARSGKLQPNNPLCAALLRVQPLLKAQPKSRVLWQFATAVPYVSHLVNPNYHGRFLKFAKSLGAWTLPFPDPEIKPLVNY